MRLAASRAVRLALPELLSKTPTRGSASRETEIGAVFGKASLTARKAASRVCIWMDIGTKEGKNSKEALQTVAGARLLYETLVKKGWQPGRDLNYFEAEGAQHDEAAWAQRVEPILKFLFPRGM